MNERIMSIVIHPSQRANIAKVSDMRTSAYARVRVRVRVTVYFCVRVLPTTTAGCAIKKKVSMTVIDAGTALRLNGRRREQQRG